MPEIQQTVDYYNEDLDLIVFFLEHPPKKSQIETYQNLKKSKKQFLILIPFSYKMDLIAWKLKKYGFLYFLIKEDQKKIAILDSLFPFFISQSPITTVDITRIYFFKELDQIPNIPECLKYRLKIPFFFKNDFIDLSIKKPSFKRLFEQKQMLTKLFIIKGLKNKILKIYWSFFNKILKGFCL